MSLSFIFIDLLSDRSCLILFYNNKAFVKKIDKLTKSENIPIILNKFLNTKKIKFNENFLIYVNLGPGSLVSARSAITFGKSLSLIYGCKLYGISYFDLLKLNKFKYNQALINSKNKKLLLNLKTHNVKNLSSENYKKYSKYKVDVKFNSKNVKNLVMSKKYTKKIVPITFSSR